MPEQQKETQTQKQKVPPNVGGTDKDTPGGMKTKTGGGQDPKKAGKDADEDEDSESSCGTGSCN